MRGLGESVCGHWALRSSHRLPGRSCVVSVLGPMLGLLLGSVLGPVLSTLLGLVLSLMLSLTGVKSCVRESIWKRRTSRNSKSLNIPSHVKHQKLILLLGFGDQNYRQTSHFVYFHVTALAANANHVCLLLELPCCVFIFMSIILRLTKNVNKEVNT